MIQGYRLAHSLFIIGCDVLGDVFGFVIG